MGIGNMVAEALRQSAVYPHYPSWGLGTRHRCACAGSTTTHYPSWGLGTVHMLDADSYAAILITPHGDWELFSGSPLHWSIVHSLPLMGIGNPRILDVRILDLVLITPHGDWERPQPRMKPSEKRPHYPSWGLGTHHLPLPCSGIAMLITPHGDWEPDRLRASVRAMISSLPLMGIGNSAFRGARSPPRYGSLPLMGIGNLNPGIATGSASYLITPHGDWELLFLGGFGIRKKWQTAILLPQAAQYALDQGSN